MEDSWPLLLQHHLGSSTGATVLDLHAGAGEHAVALARQGCRLTWVVPSVAAAAVEGADGAAARPLSAAALRERARLEGLPIAVWEGDFREHDPAVPADAVLAIGVLSTLPRVAAAALLHRLRLWTRPGGLIVLTALHVDAPEYGEAVRSWRRIGLHSFRSPAGRYRTFLGRGEILDLMLGWSILRYREHPVPGGGPEAAGLVELVAARPAGPA